MHDYYKFKYIKPDGTEIKLSPVRNLILKLFFENKNKLLQYEYLNQRVYDVKSKKAYGPCKSLVGHLKEVIGPEYYIQNVPEKGWILREM